MTIWGPAMTRVIMNRVIKRLRCKNISGVRVTCQKKLGRVGREKKNFKNFFYIEKCRSQFFHL